MYASQQKLIVRFTFINLLTLIFSIFIQTCKQNYNNNITKDSKYEYFDNHFFHFAVIKSLRQRLILNKL